MSIPILPVVLFVLSAVGLSLVIYWLARKGFDKADATKQSEQG